MNPYTPDPMLSSEVQITLLTVDDRMKDYVTKMAGGQLMSDANLALQQKLLWTNIILFALNQPAPVFMKAWEQILNRVHEHSGSRGAFHPSLSARGLGQMQVGPKDRRSFERMLSLLYTTADPKARRYSIKQVNLPMILAGLSSEQQRQKLLGFYEGL